MQLPFTPEQFFAVFRDYNTTVWPAQIALHGLAAVALVLLPVPRRWADVGVSLVLAFLWVWLGTAYHLAFFRGINPLAPVFAAASLVAASLFLWQGVVRGRLRYRPGTDARSLVGGLLVSFALVVYPLWSIRAGHPYPELPTFGLPCPTTIFTIGVLAFTLRPYPRSPLVIPAIWSLIGSQAAFSLGVRQDLGLLVAGAVAFFLIVRSGGSRDSDEAAFSHAT